MSNSESSNDELEPRPPDVEQLIDALRKGQLDSVLDESGVTLLSYKQLAGALTESEMRFESLMQNLPAAAYTCDAEGLITRYNRKAVELWGREPALNDPRDKFCGSFKLFDPVGSPIDHDQCWMARALRDGKEYNCEEINIERADGSRRTVLAHANPIRDLQGTVVGAVNVLVDVTAHRRHALASESLAAIVDSADDAIIGYDLDGRITSYNKGAERLYGYTAEEASGQPITIIVPPERSYEFPGFLHRLQRGDKIDHLETVRVRKDGTRVDVSLTISPVRDHAGNVYAASAIARDISERIKFANQRKESEEKYRDLVETSHDLIWSVNTEGRITFINRASESVYGMKPEEMIGRPYSDFVPDHQMEKIWALLAQVHQTGELPRQYENEVRHSDGSPRILSANAVCTYDADGNIIGTSGVSRDITGVRHAEQEREAAQQALLQRQQHETELVQQELNRVKNELIKSTRLATLGKIAAQIAHDLRNPLGSVRNATYYLKGELREAADDVREFVELIEGEVETCDTIIRNLLEATRSREPERRPVNVSELVRSAFQRLNAPDGVKLKLQSRPEPFYIDFDPVQCRQIIDNLLSNARDAVESDGWIEVTLVSAEGAALIRVRDSGPGVPADLRETIFDLLFTTKAKGTGLGLATCRQVIEQHGGTIELEEQEESESSFLIRIPHHE